MQNKKIKTEYGITLVALIITIIVLIILATVSISAVFNANFINIATQGTVNYAEAQVDEIEKFDSLANKLEVVVNQIEKVEGSDKSPENPELPENWDSSKVTPVKSADGVIVPVPNGFEISETEGENSVQEGLVIKKEIAGVINEFVWIPVEDPSKMFGIDKNGNALGKLYIFALGGKLYDTPIPENWEEKDGVMSWKVLNSHKEPDVIPGFDDLTINYENAGIEGITNGDEFKVQLQNEFNKIKKSVERYKGFYIGRYETGDLSKQRVVSAKGNTDLLSQNWYTLYQKSKSITEGTGIQSSMLWGCQWNAMLNWFFKDPEAVEYLKNSSGKGNTYKTNGDAIIPTGSKKEYNVKNIYDLVGNVDEMTLSVYSNDGRRAYRGTF